MPRVHCVPPLVWRLAVVWHETVLDVVTLKEGVNTVALRTGATLTLRAHGEDVVLCTLAGESTLRRGELTPLAGGHAVILSLADAESSRAFGGGVDSTLFHAVMIGAAVQVCLVSALLLAPAARPDAEAGGGIKGSMRRLLIASGGTAQSLGRPSFSLEGRALVVPGNRLVWVPGLRGQHTVFDRGGNRAPQETAAADNPRQRWGGRHKVEGFEGDVTGPSETSSTGREGWSWDEA